MRTRRYPRAGYATIVAPDRPVVEFDTQTCAHCNHVYVVRSSDPTQVVDIGGGCRVCQHAICGQCADRGGCTPFERKLDEYEARQRLFRALT